MNDIKFFVRYGVISISVLCLVYASLGAMEGEKAEQVNELKTEKEGAQTAKETVEAQPSAESAAVPTSFAQKMQAALAPASSALHEAPGQIKTTVTAQYQKLVPPKALTPKEPTQAGQAQQAKPSSVSITGQIGQKAAAAQTALQGYLQKAKAALPSKEKQTQAEADGMAAALKKLQDNVDFQQTKLAGLEKAKQEGAASKEWGNAKEGLLDKNIAVTQKALQDARQEWHAQDPQASSKELAAVQQAAQAARDASGKAQQAWTNSVDRVFTAQSKATSAHAELDATDATQEQKDEWQTALKQLQDNITEMRQKAKDEGSPEPGAVRMYSTQAATLQKNLNAANATLEQKEAIKNKATQADKDVATQQNASDVARKAADAASAKEQSAENDLVAAQKNLGDVAQKAREAQKQAALDLDLQATLAKKTLTPDEVKLVQIRMALDKQVSQLKDVLENRGKGETIIENMLEKYGVDKNNQASLDKGLADHGDDIMAALDKAGVLKPEQETNAEKPASAAVFSVTSQEKASPASAVLAPPARPSVAAPKTPPAKAFTLPPSKLAVDLTPDERKAMENELRPMYQEQIDAGVYDDRSQEERDAMLAHPIEYMEMQQKEPVIAVTVQEKAAAAQAAAEAQKNLAAQKPQTLMQKIKNVISPKLTPEQQANVQKALEKSGLVSAPKKAPEPAATPASTSVFSMGGGK